MAWGPEGPTVKYIYSNLPVTVARRGEETKNMTQNLTDLETGMLGGSRVKIASDSDVHYHRNGIGGQPFWTIKFTWGVLPMIATMGVEGDDLILSSCRVLWLTGDGTPTQNMVNKCFRGDQYAPYLAKQLNEIYAGTDDCNGFAVAEMNAVWEA